MSYEGYVQMFCVNGHIYEADQDYDYDPEGLTKDPVHSCIICGGSIYHANPVDDTNCDDVGKIDVSVLEEKSEINRVTCEVRDGRHFTFREYAPAIYKVLTKEELKKLRG